MHRVHKLAYRPTILWAPNNKKGESLNYELIIEFIIRLKIQAAGAKKEDGKRIFNLRVDKSK